MELDELKNQWKQANQTQSLNNQNLIKVIQNRKVGPIAELKRSFKKQMIAMTVVTIAILATKFRNIDKIVASPLFWFYLLFCAAVVVSSRISYNVVLKMEEMDGDIKSNLQQQICILESKLKQKVIGIRIALLFFIALTEVLPYFETVRMLHTWHSLSPFIRFGSYAGLFLFQYLLSRRTTRRRFGQHIANLKELVKQMD